MAAHRYWRAVGLEAYGGGDFELSCLHLLASGVRVDASAALTSNIAPAIGSLGNLQDDDLATSVRWPDGVVKSLALQWDFGVDGAQITDAQFAGNSEWRFALICKLQCSDDLVDWIDSALFSGIAYPGAGTKTTKAIIVAGDPEFAKVSLLLHFDGVEGATASIDSSPSGHALTFVGAAALSSGAAKYGSTGLRLAYQSVTNAAYISIANHADFDFGGGDFTFQVRRFKPLSTPVNGGAIIGRWGVGAVDPDWLWYISNNASLEFYAPPSGGAITPILSYQLSFGVAYDLDLKRAGSTLMLYVNDVLVATGSITWSIQNTLSRAVRVGVYGTVETTGFVGDMDELRISKGIARPLPAPSIGPFPDSTESGVDSSPGFLNTVRGRAAASQSLKIGVGPAITYGIPRVSQPLYLGIETGAVKDWTTGVLGQGIGRVRATVKLKNTPANTPLKRRVRLIRERDGLQVREIWSDPVTGIYDFQYIDELQAWTVTAGDHTHDKRAVIADNLTLANGGVELMP